MRQGRRWIISRQGRYRGTAPVLDIYHPGFRLEIQQRQSEQASALPPLGHGAYGGDKHALHCRTSGVRGRAR